MNSEYQPSTISQHVSVTKTERTRVASQKKIPRSPNPVPAFFKNPQKLIEHLHPVSLQILNLLIKKSFQHKRIFCSQETLAKELNYHRTYINTHLKQLEKLGLINSLYRHFRTSVYLVARILKSPYFRKQLFPLIPALSLPPKTTNLFHEFAALFHPNPALNLTPQNSTQSVSCLSCSQVVTKNYPAATRQSLSNSANLSKASRQKQSYQDAYPKVTISIPRQRQPYRDNYATLIDTPATPPFSAIESLSYARAHTSAYEARTRNTHSDATGMGALVKKIFQPREEHSQQQNERHKAMTFSPDVQAAINAIPSVGPYDREESIKAIKEIDILPLAYSGKIELTQFHHVTIRTAVKRFRDFRNKTIDKPFMYFVATCKSIAQEDRHPSDISYFLEVKRTKSLNEKKLTTDGPLTFVGVVAQATKINPRASIRSNPGPTYSGPDYRPTISNMAAEIQRCQKRLDDGPSDHDLLTQDEETFRDFNRRRMCYLTSKIQDLNRPDWHAMHRQDSASQDEIIREIKTCKRRLIEGPPPSSRIIGNTKAFYTFHEDRILYLEKQLAALITKDL